MGDPGQALEVGANDRLPVLVSACLAGRRCTYRGTANPLPAEGRAWVDRLVREGHAVLVCPEVDGGLGTPRPPAEIVGGDGHDVLDGRARVLAIDGTDVTEAYLRGAETTVERARAVNACAAVLKARSPSCGRGAIYNGSFSRTVATGDGVTAAALQRAGIAVMSDEELEPHTPTPAAPPR
ncbi:MAG: DUF523 domain-containing protein [Actinomycetota bacterium]|nr:DUF523 domain-containing protein [Actinomycetota bacterium]